MAQPGKNILFLTPRFPFPIIGGDRLKSYNVLKHLAENNSVTLVSFYQGKELPEEYRREVEKIGVKLYVILLNPITAAFKGVVLNDLRNPLEINYYTQPNFDALVQKLLKTEKYDVAFSFFMRTAEYLKNEVGMKKILMAEDCRMLYQKRSYMESKNLIQKCIRLYEYFRLKKYEPEIMKKYDIVTFVTTNDINEMRKRLNTVDYRLLTNGTDVDYFVPPENYAHRNGILFAGKLDVWANVIMVQKIVKEIMPLIWKKLPEANLNIVGANPHNEILKFASKKVQIIPNVPSMLPYLQNASVFLHPHVGGTGIQNKLLEAMSCGTPVVTTPIGNQGIDAKDGVEILLGKSAAELANHTINILENKDLSKLISSNARDLIVRTHSWDVIFNGLDELL